MARVHKPPIYTSEFPENCVVGWHGLSAVTGRSANSLKSSYCNGTLHINPIKMGTMLFFSIKDVQSLREKSRGGFTAEYPSR